MKSGSAAKFHKQYICYDQLTFLIPVIQNRPTCTNIDDSAENASNNSLIKLENRTAEGLTSTNVSSKNSSIKKRKPSAVDSTNDVRERLFGTIEQSLRAKKPSESYSMNEMFLMSLAGDMNEIPEQNILRFKVDLLKVFSELVEKYSHTNSHTWNSTPTPPYPSPIPGNYDAFCAQHQLLQNRMKSINIRTSSTQTPPFPYLNQGALSNEMQGTMVSPNDSSI